MKHIITAECMSCTPWVRYWRNPATGIPIRQVLHENHCGTYPRFSRDDIAALTGD